MRAKHTGFEGLQLSYRKCGYTFFITKWGWVEGGEEELGATENVIIKTLTQNRMGGGGEGVTENRMIKNIDTEWRGVGGGGLQKMW